jgi:hypothetical protein
MCDGFENKKNQGSCLNYPERKRPSARKFMKKKWWVSWLKALKIKILKPNLI